MPPTSAITTHPSQNNEFGYTKAARIVRAHVALVGQSQSLKNVGWLRIKALIQLREGTVCTSKS